MKFDKKDITKETLKNLRSELNYNNAQMADLLGISEKTWKNKISGEGKISKLEYEFMLLLIDKHPDYKIINRG
ncbi:antitoxin Xre-like helix-turn-helix domain-containing protein [Proteus mirabilis]|nr:MULTISPECIES: antitoxin Xre-like helix-turn-helix domain-containing protein [Proteus]ELA7741219.1 hypothetical protein [Proteus mirabilis]MBG2905677.1 hypothetical protein [Proteus mirabilis]MBG3156654.1 hypothetical protein [Proteus mirabilis]MBG5994563.1 hypothetical protein [Proteus mirabilis]MBI6207820.1 hypothetical protein [Proteus mirabilis]